MRTRVYLRRLAAEPLRLAWHRAGATTSGADRSGRGTAAELAEALAPDDDAVLLLDSTEVLLTEVAIPTRNRQKMRQAVPFALEDQLTEDVEQLHFALGRTGDTGRTAVAVTGRARLEATITELDAAGIPPARVVPDALALPREPGTWSLALDRERFVLRTGAQSGIAGDADNASAIVEMALSEAGEDHPPERIVLFDATGGAAFELGEEAPPIERQPITSIDALIARTDDTRNTINLLQGRFARGGGWQERVRFWRVPAVLAVMLVVVMTGRLWGEYWSLGQRVNGLEHRVEALFSEGWPDARVPSGQEVSVARARLERLRGGGSEPGALLSMLAGVSDILTTSERLTVSAVSFRDGRLELALSAPSVQAIDDLRQRLAAEGFEVEVRTARSRDEGIDGQLTLRRSG